MLRPTRLGPRAIVAGPAIAEETREADMATRYVAAAKAVDTVAEALDTEAAETMVETTVMATNRRWWEKAMV